MKLEFTTTQRARLSRLALSDAQIDALEGAIAAEKPWMDAKLAQMSDVRAALTDSRMKMQSAISAANSLLHPGKLPHQIEASFRVKDADGNACDERGTIVATVQSLEAACNLIDRAIDELPSVQRHTNKSGQTASRTICKRIDAALLAGHIEEITNDANDFLDKPYVHIVPSRAGKYLSVVRLCYEVMGYPDTDPDRAIQIHIEQLAKKSILRSAVRGNK